MISKNIDALLLRMRHTAHYSSFVQYDENLGLLSIATYAANNEFNVRILNDENVTIDLIKSIVAVDNINLIGFYIDADNVWKTLSAINSIKETYSDLVCVVGGPQASCAAWDAKILSESKCDYVVRGEGEKTFLNILKLLQNHITSVNSIKGITYIKDGKIIRNDDNDALKATEFPIIDRNLTYFPSFPIGIEKIYTSRGCAYHCTFCFEGIHGLGYRTRDLNSIKLEVVDLIINRQMKHLCIHDSLFTYNPRRLKSICRIFKKLQNKYRKFTWFCEGRANIIRRNPDIIKDMVESGLIRLQIGIESGNKNILSCYNKKITLDDIRETVRICYDYGLTSLVGNFIIGGPFETSQTVEQSLSFAMELLEMAPGCMEITSSIYTPYPSTEIYNNPGKFGIEILDPYCISGPGLDYPFARTESLTKWDIWEARKMFNKKIDYFATSLLPKLGDDIIKNAFKTATYHGVSTIWHRLLSRYSNYNNYFGLQVSSGMYCLKDIIDDIGKYKPLRTVQIQNIVDNKIKIVTDSGNTMQLSELSSRIYELSSGKITIDQIVNIIYDENNGTIDSEVIYEYMIDFYSKLDKEKSIIFSPV